MVIFLMYVFSKQQKTLEITDDMLSDEVYTIVVKFNPVDYPYGGKPDSSRYEKEFHRTVPLTYDSTTTFFKAFFDTTAKFKHAKFQDDPQFINAQFREEVDFAYSIFENNATFEHSSFAEYADFDQITVKGISNFSDTEFKGELDLMGADFDNILKFDRAKFKDKVTLTHVSFDTITLYYAEINKEIEVGSVRGQAYDFTRTIFGKDAKIILNNIIDLKIQPEKIDLILFDHGLRYSEKSLILDHLKTKSFKDNKSVQFELEYIFAKSVMFQEQADTYEESLNKWYEVWKWPKWLWNTFYFFTMGLGYRPFRLIYWVLFLVMSYALFYFIKMPDRINEYIAKDEKEIKGSRNRKKVDDTSWSSVVIHCLYFSSMVFFTFRLKRDILTFFNDREKRIIVTQWLLGFLIYVAFLTLSKSGSILQNLKDLFLG